MKTIKIKKLSIDFSDNYCVEVIENQKVIGIFYVEKPKFVSDIILQNIKDFETIELRFFLNELKRRKKIDRHQINLFVKSKYETIFPCFKSVVDYDYLESIIVTTLNSLRSYDRISIKF